MSNPTKEQVEEMQRRVEANRSPYIDLSRLDGGVATMNPSVVAKANLAPRKSSMNKSEAAYDQYLDALYKQGRIAYYKFEAVTLKLGDDCRLTMDFLVIGPAGEVEFHDVKAIHRGKKKPHTEDDFQVKIRTACEQFPFFTFCTVWLENGTWHKKVY